MKGPVDHPMPCPRCGAQVTGDFKFCPTCAYRLRSDAAAPPDLPAPPSRWAQILLGLVLGALIVAVAAVGFRLFRDPQTTPLDLEPKPPDPIQGVLTVRDIPDLMVNLPPGDVALWPRPDNPEEDVRVYVRDWIRVMAVEVTRSMYAEFVRAVEADPGRLPSFLGELWRPPVTDDLVANEARLAYTNDYIDWWWSLAQDHLQKQYPDREIERPRDLEAPLPERFGMLLLVPPSWLYLTGFEDLAWKMPEGTEDLPVAEVSWYEAVGFAEWVKAELLLPDLRLPLLAEWVRAGTAGDVEQRFPWGDKALRYACNSLNYWGEDEPRPLPVDWIYSEAEGRTREGLYAMSGNIREWTHNNEFKFVQSDDSAWYEPTTPPNLEEQRMRAPTLGGSFEEGIEDCTVDLESRRALEKHGRWNDVGFRLRMKGNYGG